ncbi:MAG: hypothetical protein QM582_17725 [Micropruina sp.]|uniref:hypothetical protein n=1 Tax=Micropruina sp. TaxID=2737536 RepID=UPI0039E6D2D0
MSAVQQGQPWKVIDDCGQLAVTHCDRPLLRVSGSFRMEDDDPAHEPTSQLWRTELTVVDDQYALGLAVARALAWETSGRLLDLQH